ncbi:MAG: hypothetical protein ACKOYM_01020, partial [Actinomycetes bacterium]
IFAVEPGARPDRSNVVASGLAGGNSITTVTGNGVIRRDQVGRAWAGTALIAGNDGANALVTSAAPGDTPTVLHSRGQAQTTVLERGVFVQTADRCTLTAPKGRPVTVGRGQCNVSDDERWVASWPADGGRLTVRDLRSNQRSVVARNVRVATTGVALSRDARVLVDEAATVGTARLALVDATSGEVVRRSRAVRQVGRIDPKSEGAPGFAVTVQSGDETELWFVDTDGGVTVIDRGPAILVVSTRGAITYIRYNAFLSSGTVVRRTDDGGRQVLLRGRVGGGPAGAEHVVLTRETRRGVEFWSTESAGGTVERLVTVPPPAGASPDGNDLGAVIQEFLTIGDVAWLTLTTGQNMSLVRLHLAEGHGRAVLANRAFVALNAVDTDGTALVTAAARPGNRQGVEMLSIRATADRPTVRLRLDQPIAALIHDDVVYFASSDGDTPIVNQIPARSDAATVLYRNVQLAGSLWPNSGGATTSTLVTPGLLAQQAQQRMGAGGQAAGG